MNLSLHPLLSTPPPSNSLSPSFPKMKSPFTQFVYNNYTINSHNLTNSQMTRSKTAKGLTWSFRNYTESFPERTRKAAYIIQNQTSLSKLKLILDSQRTFENHLLLFQTQHLPSLTTLELDINRKSISIIDAFKVLAIYLPHLRNLATLIITFNFTTLPGLQSFYRLLKSIKTLRNLTNLSLTFMCPVNMKDSYLDLLASQLCKLTHLHSLTLVFDNSKQLTNHSINSLALTLSKLSLLKKIQITLSGFNKIPNMVTSSTILQFFSSFQALKNLTDITLDLKRSMIFRETQADLLSEGFLSLKDSSQIQRLSLLFEKEHPLPALANLIQTLSRFSSLTMLHLDFHFCHLSTIENSLLQLQTFPSLSSLSLEFSSFLALPSLVTDVASTIKPLTALKSLKLDLSHFKLVQDEQIIMLSESLTGLTSLLYLDINLSGNELLTNKSIENLAVSFKGLTLLKSLCLHLDSVNLIGNQAVEVLAEALSSLKNLAFLSLDFENNKNIDQKGLARLVEALAGLSGLFKLCLNFFMCEGLILPVMMYEDLLRLIKTSRNIQEVEMILPYSKFIIDEVQRIKKRKIAKVTYFSSASM